MSGIVDGRHWLEERRRHLQAELGKELAPDQRQAVEAEIARVDEELAHHRRGWRRFLLFGGRIPG